MRSVWLSILFCVAVTGCDALSGASSTTVSAVRPGTNHKVRGGESLFAIAEDAYGNGLEWPRIWDANPWIDPDRLRIGEMIFVPPRDASWGDPPSRSDFALDPGTGSFESSEGNVPQPVAEEAPLSAADPGNGGLAMVRNIASSMTSKTLFGMSLEKALLFGFSSFLAHAILVGILVWLAANITFVKEASFKKSMKAMFLTESLTFATLLVVAGVGIVLLSVGADPSSAAAEPRLFPGLETFLRSPTGMGVAGFVILALYITLSLRFLPQVFGIPMGRAASLMALAILVPHLTGAYLMGQRLGLIR